MKSPYMHRTASGTELKEAGQKSDFEAGHTGVLDVTLGILLQIIGVSGSYLGPANLKNLEKCMPREGGVVLTVSIASPPSKLCANEVVKCKVLIGFGFRKGPVGIRRATRNKCPAPMLPV